MEGFSNFFSDGMCGLNLEENALMYQGFAFLFSFFLFLKIICYFCFCYMVSRPLCKLFSLPGKLIWHQVTEGPDHPTNTAVLHRFLQAFYFFTVSFSAALRISLLVDCLSPWGTAWLLTSGLCTGVEQAFTESIGDLMNELTVPFTRTSLWFFCCFLHVTAHIILLTWSPVPLSFKSPDSILMSTLLPASCLSEPGCPRHLLLHLNSTLSLPFQPPCLQLPIMEDILMEFTS